MHIHAYIQARVTYICTFKRQRKERREEERGRGKERRKDRREKRREGERGKEVKRENMSTDPSLGWTSNLEHRCDIKVTRVLFLDSSHPSLPGLYPQLRIRELGCGCRTT